MTMVRLVAVTGTKKSGKTTAAELLVGKLVSLGYRVAAALVTPAPAMNSHLVAYPSRAATSNLGTS